SGGWGQEEERTAARDKRPWERGRAATASLRPLAAEESTRRERGGAALTNTSRIPARRPHPGRTGGGWRRRWAPLRRAWPGRAADGVGALLTHFILGQWRHVALTTAPARWWHSMAQSKSMAREAPPCVLRKNRSKGSRGGKGWCRRHGGRECWPAGRPDRSRNQEGDWI
uniref:Uncharacterized protein n=1 Tax=Triticum urartu TaxID=4572 RepID=A0A8R7JX92_TRIUA